MVANMYILKFLLVNLSLVVGGKLDEKLSNVFLGKKGSHALKDGERSTQPQDSLLYNEIVPNDAQPSMQGATAGTYCYPSNDRIADQPPIVITMYEATDMGVNGDNAGEATLASGGVGQNQVCLYIKGQWGGSYKFKFKVFGYQREQDGEQPQLDKSKDQ